MSKILHILAIFITFALASCTAGRTAMAPTTDRTRADTVYISRAGKDSVIIRDSIHTIERGDSVIITRYRDRLRTEIRTDTIHRIRCDTILIHQPVEIEKVITVSRTPTAAKVLSAIGAIALLAIGRLIAARL